MKKNWTVLNHRFCYVENCILGDNDNLENEVINIPLIESELKEYTDKDSIGVWKIKKIK